MYIVYAIELVLGMCTIFIYVRSTIDKLLLFNYKQLSIIEFFKQNYLLLYIL